MTLSRLGPVERQNTLPDIGSSHARAKWTPSSASIARSRSCASWSCWAVTPTKPLWTSMNVDIHVLPSFRSRIGCRSRLLTRSPDRSSVIRPMGSARPHLNGIGEPVQAGVRATLPASRCRPRGVASPRPRSECGMVQAARARRRERHSQAVRPAPDSAPRGAPGDGAAMSGSPRTSNQQVVPRPRSSAGRAGRSIPGTEP